MKTRNTRKNEMKMDGGSIRGIGFKRKVTEYPDKDVYAIYYSDNNTLYYNMNFAGKGKIIYFR